MQTGDTVRDPSGRTFQVGQLLGRGLWGKTYNAREEPAGTEWVIKVPLGPDAFAEPGAEDAQRLARLCREIALEQARTLGQVEGSLILRPQARFTTELGLPVLILPRMKTSLQAQVKAGMSLRDELSAVTALAGRLRTLSGGPAIHGNLRPCNIFADKDGGWVCTDPLSPTLWRHLPELARARGVSLRWLPPEARGSHDSAPTDPSIDTHALAAFIFQCASTRSEGSPKPIPDDGLDKPTLVDLKDAVRNRLSHEPGNVRFQGRLSDRLATMLNRALSRETSPSPPYRFPRVDQFLTRVAELEALVDPLVSHVGRLLLDRPPGSNAFTTDEEIAFSCSVGCTPGVETHDDIACGLAVFDAETDKRLRDVPCSYTVDRHPSGRFRFGFRVSTLPPGPYRVRLAFTIRDSGHEPSTVEGSLLVHPAAGYVPPRSEPEPQAIAFSKHADRNTDRNAENEADTQQSPVPRPLTSAQGTAPDSDTGADTGADTGSDAGSDAAQRARAAAAISLDLPTHPPAGVAAAQRTPSSTPASAPSPASASTDGPRNQPIPFPRPIAPSRPDSPSRAGPSLVAPRLSPPPSSKNPSSKNPSSKNPSSKQAVPTLDGEPTYGGAGRWTDLPLPGPAGGGLNPSDQFDDGLTEPLEGAAGAGPLDRLLDLAQGESYKLFIGGAVTLILVLILALMLLR